MSAFRGTDDSLDREIAQLERIGRLRVRRASQDLRELDRDLRELKRERVRRRAEARHELPVSVPTGEVAP
jgi:hypothetical protein